DPDTARRLLLRAVDRTREVGGAEGNATRLARSAAAHGRQSRRARPGRSRPARLSRASRGGDSEAMFRLRRRAETADVSVDAPSVASEADLDPDARHDERLIRAAQAGDLPSFNAVIVRHERSVYNLCLRMLRDVSAAEDATQETFLKAWTAIGTFRGGVGRAWLLPVATHRCHHVLRATDPPPAH